MLARSRKGAQEINRQDAKDAKRRQRKKRKQKEKGREEKTGKRERFLFLVLFLCLFLASLASWRFIV
jgi:hypothetical protein